MSERRYLRPVAELRTDAAELADSVSSLAVVNQDDPSSDTCAAAETAEAEVREQTTALIDEVADWRDLFRQHVDVGGHRVRVKLGPLGRVGFEVVPLP